jgi:hypothetical protein
VNLQPHNNSGPYLRDGSVITADHTSVPQQVGPVLDQASKLIDSIPKGKLGSLLDETFTAFNGAGFDLGSLLDSTTKLSGDLNRVSGQTRGLINDGAPLLDAQAQTIDSLRVWTRSLAGITNQLVHSDSNLRNVLATGPGAVEQVSQLLNQIKPTLPVLLANLSSLSQILVTYNPSLEQLLVLFPAYLSAANAAAPQNNPTGMPMGDFHASLGDPPACTVGFLPPSQWRSPADLSDIDTPPDLYCKLPQDSPIGVRGVRNDPCLGHPGKRAPTVEICNSDKPYEPLAMRQHVLGPYPFDPGLASQGVPPDDRIDDSSRLFGPVDGTPMPPPQSPPGPTESAPLPGVPGPGDHAAPPPPGAPAVAPSGLSNQPRAAPTVVAIPYDSANGAYVTPAGDLERRPALVGSASTSWKDLVLPT